MRTEQNRYFARFSSLAYAVTFLAVLQVVTISSAAATVFFEYSGETCANNCGLVGLGVGDPVVASVGVADSAVTPGHLLVATDIEAFEVAIGSAIFSLAGGDTLFISPDASINSDSTELVGPTNSVLGLTSLTTGNRYVHYLSEEDWSVELPPLDTGGSLVAGLGQLLRAGQVPEPTTLALFAIGLAGFGFARRRVH